MLDKNDPIKAFEPIWSKWKIESFIGEGSYGRVYKAVKQSGERRYVAAVKHISVPKTETELTQARQMGMDDVSLYRYFDGMASAILKEVDIMFKLKGIPNIVGYRDYSVVHQEGKPRWDIFIRMEHLETLTAYMERTPMSEDEIVRLGIEICTALSACKAQNIIHRDIKESNIFVDSKQVFKLGDFGIAREASERSRSMSMRGTPAYLAPEIARGLKYDATVDIYSLGILLYKLLNHGRYPFMPPAPEPIRFADAERALERRLSGEALPPPAEGTPTLQAAVLKACSYRSSDRFQSPDDFIDALSGVTPIDGQSKSFPQEEYEKPSHILRVTSGRSAQQAEETRALFAASHKGRVERSDSQEEAERARLREAVRKRDEQARKRKETTVGYVIIAVGGCFAVVLAIFFSMLIQRLIHDKKERAAAAVVQTHAALIPMPTSPPTVPPTLSPTATPSPTPSPSPVPTPNMQLGTHSKRGDIVRFGAYEQDGNEENGKEAIEWIVLSATSTKAHLMSAKCLDRQQYHDWYSDITWEECWLRSWLNGTFLEAAFSKDEREAIVLTVLNNPRAPLGTRGGNTTQDYIYIASINEIITMPLSRVVVSTYAQGETSTTAYGMKIWLRTPGYSQRYATFWHSRGGTDQHGNAVTERNSVLPIIWVDLNAAVFNQETVG